jgi:F-type H+-transporting ATPase subunit a
VPSDRSRAAGIVLVLLSVLLMLLCSSAASPDDLPVRAGQDAAEGSPDVAATLFEHVLDGNRLAVFPAVPPIQLPFGLTVHFLMVLLTLAVILTAFIRVARRPSLKPTGLAMLLEILILYVRDDIVYPIMGPARGGKWLPFFFSLFIFVLVMNLIGLIPAFKAATGNLSVTSALALMILALIFAVGIIRLGPGGFFRNFYPSGSPAPIGLFVAFLEFAGTFIKGLVLSLRLFANMFAGHLAILSFLALMFVLNPAFGFISVPFAVFIYALEVLVALIQALVFCLLSCIFITMASSPHDGADHHDTEPPAGPDAADSSKTAGTHPTAPAK